MNKTKRFISIVIAICMIISLLPAQFALAAQADADKYINGYADTIEEVPEDYSGCIWDLEEFTDQPYDYKLTASARNMTASLFKSSVLFNGDDVDMVMEDGTPYNEEEYSKDASEFITDGKVNQAMTNYSSYVGKPITTKNYAFQLADDLIFKATDVTGNYYRVAKILEVNSQLTETNAARWTTDAGAVYERVEFAMAYKTPTNTNCELFMLYFKKKDGKTINADTFKPGYYESIHGGAAVLLASEKPGVHLGTDIINSEGVYMVGAFVKPELPKQTVTFTRVENSANEALSGATVQIYSDEAMTQEVTEAKGTTNSDGSYTTSTAVLNALDKYYYKVSLATYEDATGTIDVKNGDTREVPTVTMTKTSEKKYGVKIIVKDADTDELLSGAQVSVGGTVVGTTTDGVVTGKFTAEEHAVNAVLSGYTMENSAQTIQVAKNDDNEVIVKLVPERATVTLPQIKDSEGNAVAGAKVIVEKTSGNSTNAWTDKMAYDAGTQISVPKGTTFKVTAMADGYSTTTLYMSTQTGEAKLYSNSGLSEEYTEDSVSIQQIGDPYYSVSVAKDEAANDGTYIATVTLKNIEANYGTFGLRYNKDLFTLDTTNGFKLDSGLTLFDTTSGEMDVVAQSGNDDTVGYHVFSWKVASADENAVLDTRTNPGAIATYKFKLNEGKSESDIPSDAFAAMPHDKTQAAMDYISSSEFGRDEVTNYMLSRLWRYTDEANEEPLGIGRINKQDATDGGFFQVYHVDRDPEYDTMYDVRTIVSYENFVAAKTGLVFEVVDKDNTMISGAEIVIYDSEGNEIDRITTGTGGIARTEVDVPADGVTYKYTISCNGYWDIPKDGEDMPTVTIDFKNPLETETVIVSMEEKVYHEPKLQDKTDASASVEATLSGDDFAFNGKDFYFDIEPNTGYVLDNLTLDDITASIDNVECKIEFDYAMNMYKIPADQIKGEKKENGVATENGFPAEDLIIKIPSEKIIPSNEKFVVTALVGDHGSVTYPDSDTDPNVEVAGNTITVSEIAAAGSTKDFTFTAIDDGYKVDKVVINGVEIAEYHDLPSFTYKFENITADSSIAVTFWDGNTHSTESVVTLIVGEKGTVDVSEPAPATSGITNERKTYMFSSAGNLTFKATPNTDYFVNKVEKSVNGAENTVVTETSPDSSDNSKSYTVDIAEEQNVVVYVTFKHKDAQDTSNIFVTAYVAQGKGTIAPIGVLICSKNKDVKFTLTADTAEDAWRATAVEIDNEIVKLDKQYKQVDYILKKPQSDTTVGAVFTETAYTVKGIVDLTQGKTTPLVINMDAVFAPAEITFTRDNGEEVKETAGGTNRKAAEFTANLSKGTWTVTVHKRGYVDYTITDFVVEPPTEGASDSIRYFGAKDGETQAKAIVPLIGNTSGNGFVVSLEDAGAIGSALRAGIKDSSPTLYKRGDVDDDEVVSATSDMVYVKENYGKRRTVQTYTDFVGE